MSGSIVDTVFQPAFLVAMLTAVAVFATLFTVLPMAGGETIEKRMKSVALERDVIRARERARLAAESDAKRKSGGGLRRDDGSVKIKGIVERFDLKAALADENTANKLRAAGFRSPGAMQTFLFARFVLPFLLFAVALLYIFVLGAMADKPVPVRIFVSVLVAYFGFYAPNIFVSNAAGKRRKSIQGAWADALDLMLICVESGMTVEAAFRKVAEEIGVQSVELAEELALTTAELSYLSERRQAYENLSNRTQLDSIRSVVQALIQAERYGTPVAHALRVLSNESRELRMNEAEKKAAALPPKLTVPMILFFLPVLFAVILSPAGISISARGGMFG
jgi:tight adherence protein C